MKKLSFLISCSMIISSPIYAFSKPPKIAADEPEYFEPQYSSVSTRKVPDWYKDAKFGIFFHWGIYSVPAYAPKDGQTAGFGDDLIGVGMNFLDNILNNRMLPETAYSEWYYSNLQDKHSKTYKNHAEKYGKDFDYYDFIHEFNEESKKWNPDQWSEIIQAGEAEYAVLTAKHHDGVSLFPSIQKHNSIPQYQQATSRDLVGDFSTSLRNHDIKVGLYYSSYYDWSHRDHYFRSGNIFGENGEEGGLSKLIRGEFAVHVDTEAETLYEEHYKQLINDYYPEYLWSDIAHIGDPAKIQALHFNTQRENGLTNNRWRTPSFIHEVLASLGLIPEKIFTAQNNYQRPKSGGRYIDSNLDDHAQYDNQKEIDQFINGTKPIVDLMSATVDTDKLSETVRLAKSTHEYSDLVENPKNRYQMISTPEYSNHFFLPDPGSYFEAIRGFGNSFAYNAEENEDNFINSNEALYSLIDIVSKGGNLMINMAVKKDGSLLKSQINIIKNMGNYIRINKEAIKKTRPWKVAEFNSFQGHDIRVTTTADGKINVFLLDGFKKGYKVSIPDFNIEPNTKARIIGTNTEVTWKNDEAWNNVEFIVNKDQFEEILTDKNSQDGSFNVHSIPVIQFTVKNDQWKNFLNSDKSWWENSETDLFLN